VRQALVKHTMKVGLLACLALPGGCAGPGGGLNPDKVQLLTADQLHGCTQTGSVHVSVVDRLEQMQKEGRLPQELAALARRSALQLDGNTIVASTGIDNGSQSFDVYYCP
jgi:Domain of unknown function (DUF4156)